MKKTILERLSSFFTYVPKITIIWCKIAEIRSETEFCHSGTFFAFLSPCRPRKSKFWKIEKKKPGDIIILQMWTIKEDQVIYGSWDMEGDGQNFLLFWTIFPLLSSNNFSGPLSTRKVEIKRKLPEISSFYKCVPKIMITWCNGSRDMVRVGQTDERMEKVTYRDGCPT